jgi:alpha-tubulin suppressor-like RCC1 family protein
LGLNDNERRNTPTKISFVAFGLPDVKAKAVSAGYDQTFVIDFNDEIWAFGGNYFGQLGLGDLKDRLKPTKIPNLKVQSVIAGFNLTLALDFNNHVWVN